MKPQDLTEIFGDVDATSMFFANGFPYRFVNQIVRVSRGYISRRTASMIRRKFPPKTLVYFAPGGERFDRRNFILAMDGIKINMKTR